MTPDGDSDTVYVPAPPSVTSSVGPLMLTVIGSLADIVAVSLLAELFTVTCDDRSPPTVPSVTVNDSVVSDNASSVTAMSMSSVAPAADPAANVTVPDAGE